MSSGDMIVLVVVIALIGGAILSIVKSHLKGRCSCGCSDCNRCDRCSNVIDVEDGKTN